MFSGSVAQAPTALVTLTRRAWLVPVSRLTKGLIPLLLRMMARFSDFWAHSPRAPTTLTSTSSGWSVSRRTRISSALYSWNLEERKRKREWARNDYSYTRDQAQENGAYIISRVFPIKNKYKDSIYQGINWLFARKMPFRVASTKWPFWMHFFFPFKLKHISVVNTLACNLKSYNCSCRIKFCNKKCFTPVSTVEFKMLYLIMLNPSPWKKNKLCLYIALKDLSSLDTKTWNGLFIRRWNIFFPSCNGL